MRRPRFASSGVFLALALGVAIVLAACGGSDETSDAAGGTGGQGAAITATPRAATPDCSPARPQLAGPSDERATGPDGEFDFVVHTPTAYDGVSPLPVVLNYHGAGSTPDRQLDYSQLAVTAEARGFLLVAPPVGSSASAVLDHVEAGWCVDTARVFATGMSAGARVSSSSTTTSAT